MKNPIQEYAWGSKTFISQLMGESAPSEKPQAELWMGSHPKAPSQVLWNGRWISLLELIQRDPEGILGKSLAERSSNKLPFLLKVLATAKPLSIQAHPDRNQARQGFARENELKIPLDAPHRNYKDENHKPEILCALTPFWALKGFRMIDDVLESLDRIGLQFLKAKLSKTPRQSDQERMEAFFVTLMRFDKEERGQILSDVIPYSKAYSGTDPAFEWVIKLHREYPNDLGVLSPIFLNLVRLHPGEALYIHSGELHAYLEGAGIELMANSDNVVRGGLTPKHTDVSQLKKILNFTFNTVDILRPKLQENGEGVYPTAAEEFMLSVISTHEDSSFVSARKRNVEILICTAGKARITNLGKGDILNVTKGMSVIVPARVRQYKIEGEATLYKAMAPPSMSTD